MTEIPIDWIKRIHWVKRFMRNVQTNQTVPYPDAGIWDSCTGWKSGARITKSKGLNTHNAIRIRLGNVSGAPLRRQPLSGLRAHPIGERTMRTKGICNHDVSSPTSSLGDVYGFTMNNEIDDQFIETGRTSVFNGYRACHSCGSVFHMGRKMLDKYGAIAELDGRPIDAKGVWKIWAVWTSEATERNRRWIA